MAATCSRRVDHRHVATTQGVDRPLNDQRGTNETATQRECREADAPDMGGRLPGWEARWSDKPGRLALVRGEDRVILFARKVPRRVPARLLDEIEHCLAGGASPHRRDRAPLAALPDELADVAALEGGEHDADAG